MGKAYLKPAEIPAEFDGDSIIARKAQIGSKEYSVTCVSVGNPHCVIFVDNVDRVDIEKVGPQIENADIFPERINTEFVRVVNSRSLKCVYGKEETEKHLRAAQERALPLLRLCLRANAQREKTLPLS